MILPSEQKAKKKEGWFVKGDVYHPNVMLAPEGVWKKLIVRTGVEPNYATVEALRTADPYTYSPTLKRLVCTECHGPDSKIKTFYGAPSTGGGQVAPPKTLLMNRIVLCNARTT